MRDAIIHKKPLAANCINFPAQASHKLQGYLNKNTHYESGNEIQANFNGQKTPEDIPQNFLNGGPHMKSLKIPCRGL